MPIDFCHAKNLTSDQVALTCLNRIFTVIGTIPKSVLDVGTGTAEWARASHELGVDTIWGIDGIQTSQAKHFFPPECFLTKDLNSGFELGRTFELCICLEVAEHLREESAASFVESLTKLADTILFSAAIPHQPGFKHINCQPPGYWQAQFNKRGFACFDLIRTELKKDSDIFWWYRQNMFLCRKDEKLAGMEPRIEHIVLPECLAAVVSSLRSRTIQRRIYRLIKKIPLVSITKMSVDRTKREQNK